MEILLIVLCVAVSLLAIVVFSPVVVAVDSRNRQVRLRWLFVLQFLMPLPGTAGEKRLWVFQKAVPLRPQKPAKQTIKTSKAHEKRRARGRFFLRCMGDSVIRHALAQQVAKLVRRMIGSVDLSRWMSEVSLPDPALNGMLAGALAASGRGLRSGVQVNFTGENSFFLELRLHPHRVFKALLFFVFSLPYGAMFKVWRALPAARPQQQSAN